MINCLKWAFFFKLGSWFSGCLVADRSDSHSCSCSRWPGLRKLNTITSCTFFLCLTCTVLIQFLIVQVLRCGTERGPQAVKACSLVRLCFYCGLGFSALLIVSSKEPSVINCFMQMGQLKGLQGLSHRAVKKCRLSLGVLDNSNGIYSGQCWDWCSWYLIWHLIPIFVKSA